MTQYKAIHWLQLVWQCAKCSDLWKMKHEVIVTNSYYKQRQALKSQDDWYAQIVSCRCHINAQQLHINVQAPASTCNNKQLTRDPLYEYHSINTCMGGGHIWKSARVRKKSELRQHLGYWCNVWSPSSICLPITRQGMTSLVLGHPVDEHWTKRT